MTIDILVEFGIIRRMSMFIGKEIEITHINPSVKSIGILIHLYCAPVEVQRPETQEKIARYVKFGCRYLQQQGFIPDVTDRWITHIGGVVHGQPL